VRKTGLVLMLLLATAVWGWTFVVVKDAVATYGVVAFLALRFAIGAALLGALDFHNLNKRSILVGSGIGIVLATGYYCQTLGLRYTTVTNSGFITSLFVVTTPIINRLLFGVKIRPMFWAAVAVSLAGLYLLTSAGATKEQAAGLPVVAYTVGDLLTLAAAVLYGLHIALLDRFAKGHPPLTLAFGQTSCTALLFLLVWPLSDPLQWPTADVWIALAITGVLATAAAFAIQTYVQQRLSAITSTLILTAEPVFATFFGCVLLGERLGGVQMLGIGLMIAAIVAAQIGAGEHASTYPLDPL
jgi:drug/metabolite transporter (DMT)-like permease